MNVVTLDLPLAPSANSIWRVNRTTGKPYLNPRYRAWKKDALSRLWTQKPKGGFPFFAGAFSVQIIVALKMRGDVDNRIKATMDFLADPARIIANDKHAHSASIARSADIAKGYCRVIVFDAPAPSSIARAAA
jgi:Holliday junction resolvase RusA-like endonuclease